MKCLSLLSFVYASLMILKVNGQKFLQPSPVDVSQSGGLYDTNFEVNQRIVARWINNMYYPGKIAALKANEIDIHFDDGDTIVHSIHDVSAVIPDSVTIDVHLGQHVLAKKGNLFLPGFVSGKSVFNRWIVTLDDNRETFNEPSTLIAFPEISSPHEVGARVFARWTNGLYYRGFVVSNTQTTVFIRYDDGDTIHLPKSDRTAVIIDHLPCYHEISEGTRIIGYWPARDKYYPGVVTSKKETGSNLCLQNGAYSVRFDDGDKRVEDFHQLRRIPYSCAV